MGTDILDAIDLTPAVPSQQDGFAKDFVALQLAWLQVPGQGDEVPDVMKEAAAELGVRTGRLGDIGFTIRHGDNLVWPSLQGKA